MIMNDLEQFNNINLNDDVICKNSLIIRTMTNEIIGKLFTNNTYKISHFDSTDTVIWIIVDDLIQPFNMYNSNYSPWNFDDYFYTKKELRNIKLKKFKNE